VSSMSPNSAERRRNGVPKEREIPATPAQRGWVRRTLETAWAILMQRCPRCHKGRMFRGVFQMNDPCPVCNLLFQREEGYFLGAMYASYVLAGVVMAAIYFPLAAALRGYDGVPVSLIAVVLFLPLTPIIFRYSRTLWIYFERAGNPSDHSAGPYEKARRRELDEQRQESHGESIDAGKPSR
jgi:uncharacterized protein (DUF983 family)